MKQLHKCISHVNRKNKLKNNTLSFIEYERLIHRTVLELRPLVTELVLWRHGLNPGGGRLVDNVDWDRFPAFPDSITRRRRRS